MEEPWPCLQNEWGEAGYEAEGGQMGSTVCAARPVAVRPDVVEEGEARELSSAPTRNASHTQLPALEKAALEPSGGGKDALSCTLTKRLHTLFLTGPLASLAPPTHPRTSTSCSLSGAEHADMEALFALLCAAADNASSHRRCEAERAQRSSEQLHISWGAFQQAFGLHWNAPIIKRIFDLMQPNASGGVSFERFARVLAPICAARAPLGAKLHFLFQCLDLDGSEGISKSELHFALRLALANTAAVPPHVLEQVLDNTFQLFQLDSAGEISWRAFERYYSRQPQQAWLLVAPLSFNVNRLTASIWMSLPDTWMLPDPFAPKAAAPEVVLGRGHTPRSGGGHRRRR